MQKTRFSSLKVSPKTVLVSAAAALSIFVVSLTINSLLHPNHPTISDVLSRGHADSGAGGLHPNVLIVSGLVLGLLAMTVKSYQELHKSGRRKKHAQLAFASYEGELGKLREEIKESLFVRDQVSRESAKVRDEMRFMEEENRRLKNELQKRFEAEELLKKSNEALRKGYDKLVWEKDKLVHTATPIQPSVQNLLFTATPKLDKESPEREKQREAVEKLIDEVDQILSEKKVNKKAPKTKVQGKKEKKK